jgi:predicted ATPase/class 3 adenylate cyclase
MPGTVEFHGSLSSYVPEHVLRRLAAGGPPEPPFAEPLHGAVLLGDIRGFTRLTEQMAERGPDGVETLTASINDYFSGMIDAISARGGEVVSFAGDAVLALWPAEPSELADALHAAAACALGLGERDADVAAGVDARLQVRLAVAAGQLSGIQVGHPSTQIHCFLTGTPLERVAEAIEHAAAGEVAVDADGWALLERRADGRPCPDGSRVLTAVHGTPRVRHRTPIDDIPDAALAPYIPPSVLDREAAATWIAELRRLTVFFVDLPDLVHGVALDDIQTLIAAVQADVERHAAQIHQIGVDNHGTSLLGATGLPPHAHADDPERGVRTAIAVSRTLERLGWRGTIGVATGRALCCLVGNRALREYAVLGDSVNIAARLSTTGAETVLCDAATVEATRARIEYGPPIELTVKGKSRPITAYQPAGRRTRARTAASTAFGRRREQRLLRAAIERTAAGARGTIAIQAEPGLGKSRLLAEAEALARARGLRTLSLTGDAIELSTPYHAWRQVFAELLGVDERAPDPQQVQAAAGPLAPLLNVVLGLDLPDTEATAPLQNERRIQATRQFLGERLAAAAASPLLLTVDDAQWLDSASWALLREFVRRRLPVLTVLASRPQGTVAPEYQQVLAEPGAQLVELGPLADDDALELACDRLGAATLSPEVEELILDRAAGNPLFVEEIAHALRDAELVTVEAGTGRVADGADLAKLALPDTVEGVIANRMEGLEPRVDLTLKVASVVGRTFPSELVRDVYPVATQEPELDACLDTLVRRELTTVLQPPPATAYAFRHVLVRDVAYGRMLYGQRRTLHRAIGEWHERRFADNLAPFYATLAHHYTQAGDVERACDYLGRASVQAINNGMGREAVDLGLAAAAMLGVELPRTLPEIGAAIERRLAEIREHLHGRDVERLADLPPARDPAMVAAIGTLLQTAPAAFISQQSELFALIGLEGFKLTLEHGATPFTPGVIALYALLVRNLEPDPRPAYALSSLAERLAERDSPPLLSYAGFVHSWFVHHWLEPIETDLPRIQPRADAGFEHGDVMFGCFNLAGYVTQLAASGAPLDEVIAAGEQASERVAGRVAASAFHCLHEAQFAKALAGRTTGPTSLSDLPREGSVDEERDLASVRHTDLHNQQAYYLSSKLRLHFYYRDYARAIAYGDQAERLLPAFRGQQQEVEFTFFHALALLAHARDARDEQARSRGEELIDKVKAWAQFAPSLFGYRVQMLEAQAAWARREPGAAAAFARAAAHAPTHQAALAHELAGHAYREAGDEAAAREQLAAAVRAYEAWGAHAKAADVAAAL